MRWGIIIWLLFGLIAHASLYANESEHFVRSFVLAEERLVKLISLYEKTTGQDIEADLEYSYLINYNSRGPLTKARFVQTLEALIEIQGLLLVREEGKIVIRRESKGQFFTGPVSGLETRLSGALGAIREAEKDEIISVIVLKEESVFQLVDLVSNLLGAPIMRGPGLQAEAKVNWEASNITIEDAVIAMDALLVEQGVFLVEEDGLLKALVREPVNREIPSVEGVGLKHRGQLVPMVRPKREVINRRVIIPED